jgi:hypothetical protein
VESRFVARVVAVGGGISARRMSANRMPVSRGIAPLADIPDREGGDGGPELVIRGEHPCLVSNRQTEPVVAAARQVRTLTVGEGNHVFGAPAGRLRQHARTDRIVVGEKPDPGVEIKIATGHPVPAEVERPSEMLGVASAIGLIHRRSG